MILCVSPLRNREKRKLKQIIRNLYQISDMRSYDILTELRNHIKTKINQTFAERTKFEEKKQSLLCLLHLWCQLKRSAKPKAM